MNADWLLIVVTIALGSLALAWSAWRTRRLRRSGQSPNAQRLFAQTFDELLRAAHALDRGVFAPRHVDALARAFDPLERLEIHHVQPLGLREEFTALRHELGNTVHAVRLAGELALAGIADENAGRWRSAVESCVHGMRAQVSLVV